MIILLKSDFNVIANALQRPSGSSFPFNVYSTLVLLVLLAAHRSVKADEFSPSEEMLHLQYAVMEQPVAVQAASLKGETSCFHKSYWTLRELKGYRVEEGGSLSGVLWELQTTPNPLLPLPIPSMPSILQPPVL